MIAELQELKNTGGYWRLSFDDYYMLCLIEN